MGIVYCVHNLVIIYWKRKNSEKIKDNSIPRNALIFLVFYLIYWYTWIQKKYWLYESSFIADSELEDDAFYFGDQDNIRHFNNDNMEEAEQELQEIMEEFRKSRIQKCIM